MSSSGFKSKLTTDVSNNFEKSLHCNVALVSDNPIICVMNGFTLYSGAE